MEWWKLTKKDAKFEDLKGKVLKAVKVDEEVGGIFFTTEDNRIFALVHYQDCCENVWIESVVGNLEDLVGEPILVAEEATNHETPSDYTHEYEPDSQTWTFYKLATRKGYVDIRWVGESNGYYSESVSFIELLD